MHRVEPLRKERNSTLHGIRPAGKVFTYLDGFCPTRIVFSPGYFSRGSRLRKTVGNAIRDRPFSVKQSKENIRKNENASDQSKISITQNFFQEPGKRSIFALSKHNALIQCKYCPIASPALTFSNVSVVWNAVGARKMT
jgi:hypothetical protein